jgi:hypothetical protein
MMKRSELIAGHVKTINCLSYGHSYEILDYVIDIDHKCYRLQLQCSQCGLEGYDKIDKNMKISSEYEYPAIDTYMRYYKQTDELFTPTIPQMRTISDYSIGGEE